MTELPTQDEPRQWTISVLAPCDWITANQLNNRHTRFTRSALTKQWREAVVQWARHAKLPTGLDYIRVDAVARFLGRPPVRDRDNLRPTLKAAIDALTPQRVWARRGKYYVSPGCGLIPDDCDRHLAGSDIRIGDPLRTSPPGHPGLLILNITEVTR